MKVFRNNDGLVRFDLDVGLAFGRMDHTFQDNYRIPGSRYFAHRLRRWPRWLSFPWISCCGTCPKQKRRVWWTGSQIDSRASWHLRLGGCYLGGRTPAWIKARLHAREVAKMEAEWEAYTAGRGDWDDREEGP